MCITQVIINISVTSRRGILSKYINRVPSLLFAVQVAIVFVHKVVISFSCHWVMDCVILKLQR